MHETNTFSRVKTDMALIRRRDFHLENEIPEAFHGTRSAFGATFVGMQAFEWTKLISEGVRPWGNPWGAPQFGSSFFMITGFHGTHVTIGVIFLINIARKVLKGDFDIERQGFFTSRKGRYEIVEITGLYWHFVDLVWVFIFALFYLW